MGKTFDPAKPEDYIKSFAIKRRDGAGRLEGRIAS